MKHMTFDLSIVICNSTSIKVCMVQITEYGDIYMHYVNVISLCVDF